MIDREEVMALLKKIEALEPQMQDVVWQYLDYLEQARQIQRKD